MIRFCVDGIPATGSCDAQQAFSCNQGPGSLESFVGPVQINEIALCFKTKPFLTLMHLFSSLLNEQRAGPKVNR